MSLAHVLGRLLFFGLTETLAPSACVACDARLSHRSVFCPTCAASVVRAGPATSALPIHAFALFGGPLAVALRRLKYEGRPDMAVPLGHLARHAARAAHLSADMVVPVPLHPKRLADRGYNQAALLGAEVAYELGVPMRARMLERTRNTPQQAHLDRQERWHNLTGAFDVRRPQAVRGQRVLLLDDVATTGATLSACAAALMASGTASVRTLVVARTEAGSF